MPHLNSVYQGALRLTRKADDAEDLVQDTILRAMRGFHRFRDNTNFKAWLLRIMTNHYINEYHRRCKQPQIAKEVEPADLGGPDASGNPEVEVLRDVAVRYLHEAIDELPTEFRTAVMLVDEQGLSYDEAATIIERPVGTIRSRLHRGRRLLKRRLARYAREAGYI